MRWDRRLRKGDRIIASVLDRVSYCDGIPSYLRPSYHTCSMGRYALALFHSQPPQKPNAERARCAKNG